MIDIRPFASLGHADHGWLDARHHFSFAGYHDPGRMGWGPLRVWNDDCIAAGAGFPPHSHRDMEIITYARTGAISHKDSLGNSGRTPAGEVQVMSAGRGIQHSEYNNEPDETKIFQIWIEPRERGGDPYWNTRAFPAAAHDGFTVLASGYGDDAALPIRADGRLLAANIRAGETRRYRLPEGRRGYMVADTGVYLVNSSKAKARDGVAFRDESDLLIKATEDTALLLVETA